MSLSAIITITLAWTLITGFTGYFFLKVLKTPQEKK